MCTCPCKYSCVKQHLLNANGWPKDLPSCLWLVFGTVAEGKWRSKLAGSALRNQLFSLWLKSGDEALPRPLAETPAGVFDKSDLELFKDRSETFFTLCAVVAVSVGAVLRAHGSMGRCLEPNHGNISLE